MVAKGGQILLGQKGQSRVAFPLIKTTQRYAKVTQDKIDRDVDKLGEVIEGKFSLYGIDTMNMRDGSLICVGKENADWNC